MFKEFYFFLVSNAERGVAFSAEGFLYVIKTTQNWVHLFLHLSALAPATCGLKTMQAGVTNMHNVQKLFA